MLRQIIRKEILDHLMSLRFAIACVLCFIVILCSLFVRHQDYGQTLKAYDEDSRAAKSNLDKLDHPWILIWRGIPVYHPPNPLKIFVRGVEDQNGYKVTVLSAGLPYFETAGIANPLLSLFPSMDMLTFVGIIMSLLAVVFGHDVICGEKERGTLRLMLSYGVPRDTVLLAKWIGGYMTLIIPFLLAVISGAAFVMVQADVALTGLQWRQFAGVCVISLLYIAVMFSAAMWISCVTARSSTSIMVLVTLWMVFVLAIPNLSSFLAQTWRPTRNLQEVEQARITSVATIWKDHVEKEMEKYDKAHGFEKGWQRRINWGDWNAKKRVAERRKHELELERGAHLKRVRMFRQENESFMRELDSQIALSRWISRVSPFSCFAMAATELTDTGIHSKRRFMDQIQSYQAILCEYGSKEWIVLQEYELNHEGQGIEWSENRQKPIPQFVFEPAPGREYLKMAGPDAGILAGMAALFFMLSYVSFLRYDVR